MRCFTFRLVFIITILLMWCGCKPTAEIQQSFTKAIPAKYSGDSTATSGVPTNWKNYFSDTVLIALIDTALHNNLDLMVAMQRIQIANAQVKQAQGAYLPSVSAAASLGRNRYGLYTMDGAGNHTTHITPGNLIPSAISDLNTGFTSSWELDIWGKLRNKKRAALARYLATVEGKNWLITTLISEVAITYYELLTLDMELDIVKENAALQEDALEIVTIQKEAGMVNELAIKQFQAQLLNSKSLNTEFSQKITENESRLNILLGRFPQAIKRNKNVLMNTMPSTINLGVPADLLRNRPDIRQAEYGLQATKADVSAARAAFYPSLNIMGGIGFRAFQPQYLYKPESMVYDVLGGLTAPLINRAAIKAQFATAKASQLEAMYHYQKTILNGYVEVYNQLSALRNLQQSFAFKTQEVDVLNKSIETSSELFRRGRATYLEVIYTQKNALQTKLELVNVKKRQFDSSINIYKALGGGW